MRPCHFSPNSLHPWLMYRHDFCTWAITEDTRMQHEIFTTDYAGTYVRLQNLPWSKTGLVSRQVLHPLSKLQNWIWSKTGRYKTCLESNTKIDCIYIYTYIYIYVYIYIFIYSILLFHIYLYTHNQSILVFDSMQVLYWPVLGQIQFCSFDRRCKTCLDTKPALCLLLNRLCACAKPTAPKPALYLLLNRLCACGKPAAPKPA